MSGQGEKPRGLWAWGNSAKPPLWFILTIYGLAVIVGLLLGHFT